MDKQEIHKGIIKGFSGSWGSGLAMLEIEDFQGGRVEIPCDNAPTVRALENAFGNVIGNGYDVKSKPGYKNQEIFYTYDDMGLCLGRFVPASLASRETVEKYRKQFKVKTK